MFEYSLVHWTTFFLAAILLNLSPGPDIAYILAQTAKNGKRAGFLAMFGIWTGALFHVLLAAIGLSAILATSAVAFAFVKWIGAGYLIWLGIAAIRSGGSTYSNEQKVGSTSDFKTYRQGILVATLNPKVAVFFLAFLPQFVVEGAGPAGAQLFVHGLLIIVVAALIEPPLVLAGARLSDYLKQNLRLAAWMDRGLGAVFIALGVRLAISERS